jgi:hypothetical protein
MFVNDNHTNWDEFIPAVINAYNCSVQSSTKFTPFEIIFNRKAKTIMDRIANQSYNELRTRNVNDYVNIAAEKAERIKSIVNMNLENARKITQKNYDKWRRNNKNIYQVGDLVLITNERKRVGHTAKFEPKATGPFRIEKIINEHVYTVRSVNDPKKELNVHYNRMRKFISRSDSFTTFTERNKRSATIEVEQQVINIDLGDLLAFDPNEQINNQLIEIYNANDDDEFDFRFRFDESSNNSNSDENGSDSDNNNSNSKNDSDTNDSDLDTTVLFDDDLKKNLLADEEEEFREPQIEDESESENQITIIQTNSEDKIKIDVEFVLNDLIRGVENFLKGVVDSDSEVDAEEDDSDLNVDDEQENKRTKNKKSIIRGRREKKNEETTAEVILRSERVSKRPIRYTDQRRTRYLNK